jgi:Predicted membrane protein (DUF2339)
MLELVLVVIAVLALSEPTVSIVFALAAVGLSAWKQNKLRLQLQDLAELNTKQNDALHRELLELKRQIAAAPVAEPTHGTPQSVRPAVQTQPVKVTAPAAPEVQKAPQAVITTPVIVPPASAAPHVPAVEKLPDQVAARDREEAKLPVPEVVEPPKQRPVPPAVVAPPIAAKSPAETKPAPVLPAPSIPPRPPVEATPPPLSRMQMPTATAPATPAAPPSAPATPPPPTARVTAPSQHAAFHASAPAAHPAAASVPKATSQERMKSVFALEEILGTRWLNKIGIVLIVVGIVFAGKLAIAELGAAGKVALSYTISLALLGGGVFLEKRERYRVFSYPAIGGGWALLFWTTYALNHVAAMQVLGSLSADLILMLAVALAMVVHTLRYRSQVVTGIAFLLAYGTVALSDDNVYSLSAGVILAIGLVAIVIKMGWFELEVFGILSSYGNHLYWLYRRLGPNGAEGHAFPDYHASTAILLFYWITYRISYIVRKTKSPTEEHISTAAALLNTLLLLGTMKFQSVQPKLAFWALLIIGAIEFSLGQLSITKRRREAFIVLSVLGAALMIGAVPFRYSGNNVAILWLIGAEAFLAAGVMVGEVVFRRLGLFAGLLVGLHLVGIDFQQIMVARRVGDNVVLDAGVVFALCAVVFYMNTLLAGKRWPQFFTDPPDAPTLTAHSYLGCFSAAAAAWALFSADWTALAFAGVMLTLAVLGQKLRSIHLQVQYGILGLLTLYRVSVVNLHSEVAQYTHVQNRLITLPILAAAFYLTAKWAATREDDSNQRFFRGMFAFAGTALITALIYFEVPELSQPLAGIAFAVLLLEVGQQTGYPVLAWHAHLLGVLATLAAVTADPSGVQRWHNIPLHAFAALPVVVGVYWIARRIRVPNPDHVRFGRIAYSSAGTGLMVWVLNEAVPAPWIAVSWIVFAVILALVMRRIGYRPLGWQANAVAACALVRAYTFNLELEQSVWGVSLRLVTIAIVAAGLYFLSRQSTTPDSEGRQAIAYLHTFAATALLAFLAWHEAPNAWLAVIWAVFALVLALVDRRFELEDLRWQAHALAALTMARSVTVNLYVTDHWHGMSVRLLSLASVAVIFYAMSRLIRMPEQFREREFHHIYSWAASALVSLLLWYELESLSIAVGWAVFGLVLFEYGLWRKVRQFRFQAYVALAASFGRIFFANLTAGNPGEFWGPRTYTVLPITLILFFVYFQLDEQSARDDRGFHFDMLLAYLGTGTVVALLYFQFANEWLVTAWAAVVFILLGVAVWLDRPLFLIQSLLLAVGVCTRGVMHNLFGASYFTGGDWTGRYFVLSSAIAILLACLPFAFQWRDRYRAKFSDNWFGALMRHPEQFMFFAPVALLTLMLAIKMRAGMVTVAWGVEALSIMIFAFVIKERSFRLTGFLLLIASFGKILLLDMWSGAWTWRDRYITFVIVGVAMVSASFLYNKYSEKIRQFL